MAVGGTTVLLALLLGRLDLVVLVLPLATAVVAGLALSEPPRVASSLRVDPSRVLENESVQATVRLRADRPADVDVALTLPAGVREAGRPARRSLLLAAGTERSLTFPLEAARWGARTLGPVALRAWGPGRFVTFHKVFSEEAALGVYPAVARLRTEVVPPRTQVFSGNYVSRASGDGLEFADVRELVPGDSPRRINWRVSTRRQRLHIDEFHPERNADVVLFLDTFVDVGAPGRSSLDLAVRGAATLAGHYVRRKDRVGLVSFGGLFGWLITASGRAHMHRLVDYLIATRATTSYASKEIGYLPRRALPPLALVIAFSPLVDERALKALVELAGQGRALVVVDTLAEDAVAPGRTPEDALAHRAWRMLRAAKRFELTKMGVPVIAWDGREGLDAVLASLPDLRRMPGQVVR